MKLAGRMVSLGYSEYVSACQLAEKTDTNESTVASRWTRCYRICKTMRILQLVFILTDNRTQLLT